MISSHIVFDTFSHKCRTCIA